MKEFYYGTQPMEIVPDKKYLQYVIEMIGGPDRLMYASDYPHAARKFPNSPARVLGWESISPDRMEKLMWGNAVRFFGKP